MINSMYRYYFVLKYFKTLFVDMSVLQSSTIYFGAFLFVMLFVITVPLTLLDFKSVNAQ
jgi:hypothetical protein